MSTKMMMFFAGCFFIGTFLCLILEGSGFGQQDIDVFNALTGYNVLQISGTGIWAIPKLAFGFITHGLPKLIMWDYSFFYGGYSIFRIALIAILSVGFLWGITQAFIGIAQGMLSRLH